MNNIMVSRLTKLKDDIILAKQGNGEKSIADLLLDMVNLMDEVIANQVPTVQPNVVHQTDDQPVFKGWDKITDSSSRLNAEYLDSAQQTIAQCFGLPINPHLAKQEEIINRHLGDSNE